MRTIATLQAPDGGSITMRDIDVLEQPEKLRAQLGDLPQEFGLYPNMPTRTTQTNSAASADVQVTVRAGAITAPDAVRPEWRRLHADEADGEHIVVLFRLAEPTNATHAVTDFIAVLDTAPGTLRSTKAVGGPAVRTSGGVILERSPGEYGARLRPA